MKSLMTRLVGAAGLLALATAKPLPADADFANIAQMAEINNINGNMTALAPALRKRGVSYNNANYPQLFKDEARSKVYWMNNWGSNPGGNTNTWFEYVPMLWNADNDHTSHWFQDVQTCANAGGEIIHVFSFNEPDQCGNGGACMQDIGKTVAAHKQWIEPLRAKYGKKLSIVSPSITNGYRDGNKLMGLDYMKEFLRQCNGCQIDYIGVHWYDRWDNPEYFKKHLREVWEATGRYVWITEFAPFDGNEAQKIDFLKKVLPWLDEQYWVYRYSYFWAAQGSLVNGAGNGLSELGKVYNTY